MAASKSHRALSLILAVIFLLTSVGFSIAVVMQTIQQTKQKEDVSNNLNAAQQEKKAEQQQKKENSLQGTKLQDFTPVAKIDSLTKIDTQPGTGQEVKPGDTVTAHYTGAVAATGVIFQSSHDSGNPIPFGLNQVIKGWTDGVPGMKVGGKRRLLIPADQAYGAQPPEGSGIPANADLVFDIEITKIGE